MGDYTIEHINPDSEDQKNALIGNLLPLEAELNKRCEDKPLNEKIPIYKESRFASTRKFAERYSNCEFNPNSRACHIAATIYRRI